jgi:hypothetical protein
MRNLSCNYAMKDGFLRVPDAPGLGMAVNVARLENYLVDTEICVQGQVVYRTPNLDSFDVPPHPDGIPNERRAGT